VEVTDIQRSGANITAKVTVGSVAAGPAWQANKKVLQAYASSDAQNAWANIESLGWRKIKAGAADGVTNLFSLFCAAVASGRMVTVYADATEVSIAYLL
jgi:hypothetical protein